MSGVSSCVPRSRDDLGGKVDGIGPVGVKCNGIITVEVVWKCYVRELEGVPERQDNIEYRVVKRGMA